MLRISRFAIFIAMPFALAACSISPEIRHDTIVIGLYVQSVKQSAETYKAARDIVTVADVRHTNYIDDLALDAEQRVQQEIAIWQITGDKKQANLFDGLRASPALIAKQRDEVDAARQEHKAKTAAAHSAAEFKVEKLQEAASALAKLGEEKSKKDDLGFYLSYVKSVKEQIDKTTKDNTKAAAEAATSKIEAKTVPDR